ncbi:MAG: SDR family oxidoreductase [SAR202 cluster bacterium]|nr:SDR family oxidoreductase [SAR202 cluster bacterium]
MELKGKKALVTGAASGIGREITLLLAKEGAKVAVTDIAMLPGEGVLREVAALHAEGLPLRCDVSSPASVDFTFSTVTATFGGLDILVNCAGIGGGKPLIDETEEQWDKVMDTNLKGAFLCSQQAARAFIKQGRGGRIVNIASTAADNARPGASAYSASKAGMVQFTKVLALELGPHNITVNAVSPAMTDFSTGPNPKSTPAYREAFIKQVPLGRAAQASEVAQAVLFLASDKAAFITGEVIHVDGGYSAGKTQVRG